MNQGSSVVTKPGGGDTLPPPVANLITVEVTFSSKPATATASFADMKYNKSAGLILVKDDGGIGDYSAVFPYLNGGSAVDGVTYPGVSYTDGCGKPVKWKYTFALVGQDTKGNDSHLGVNPTITSWTQYKQIVQAGFSIANHTLTHGAGTTFYDRLNQVKANEKVIFDALQYRTRTFVIPANYEGLTETAVQLGYPFIGSQFGAPSPDGNNDPGNVTINWNSRVKVNPLPSLKKLLVSRLNLGDNWTDTDVANAKKFVDNLFTTSTGNTKYMGHAFSHGPTGAQQLANFATLVQYIQSHPGNSDRTWIPGMQEFYEYYEVKANVVQTQKLANDKLLITLDLATVNPNNRYRDMSLLVNSDAAIASVRVTGADSSSYNSQTGLINIFSQKTKGFTDPALDALPPQIKSVSTSKAAPNEVEVQYDRAVTQSGIAGYTVAGKTITGIRGLGLTWTLTLSDAITPGQSLTLDYRMQSGTAADAADATSRVCSYIAFPIANPL